MTVESPPEEDVNTTLLLESKARNFVLVAVPAASPVRFKAEAVMAFDVVLPLLVTASSVVAIPVRFDPSP